jgi:hypothetical protein
MPEDSLGIEVPDPDAAEAETAALHKAAEDAGWPHDLESSLRRLRQVKPEKVVNASNLGDLAFTDAEAKITRVVHILSDLRDEDWEYVRPELRTEIVGNANGLLETMRQMAELWTTVSDTLRVKSHLRQLCDSVPAATPPRAA